MSPLRLRGSCLFWVTAAGTFAASLVDSRAGSTFTNGHVLETTHSTASATERGERHTFKFWTTQDGLPRNRVSAIAQTADSYLWVGTVNGLARFDGVRFQAYTAANTPELFSDTINVLYEDRARRLWIGTIDGGVACYDRGRFTLYSNADGLRSITINAVTEDGDGGLWVGTAGGLHRFVSGGRFERVPRTVVPVEVIAGLRTTREGDVWVVTLEAVRLLRRGQLAHSPIQSPKVIRCFEADRFGDLWLGFENGGLARVSARTMTLAEEDFAGRATALHRDGNDNLWLGKATGELWQPDSHGGWTTVATPFNTAIRTIQSDSSGNLWLGSEGSGLCRMREKSVMTYTMEPGPLTAPFTSVAEDHQGRIWAGTMGRGLLRWDGTHFIESPTPLTAKNITAVLGDRDGGLICGTLHVHYGELYRRTTAGVFSAEPEFGQRCRALFTDREGGVWVGKWRGGLEHYKDGRVTLYATNGLSNDRIYSIAQDRQGDMWIGTLKGLNRLSRGSITRFYREDGLGANDIRAVFVDSQGTLWAGSSGGLSRYHQGRFATISMREGLIGECVDQILEDDDGNLWLGSNAGLMRASLRELNDCASGKASYVHCVAFRGEEGLSVLNTGTGFQPSSLKMRDGRLWFGAEAGFVVIDPKQIKPNPKPPPVYIERVSLDGEIHEAYPSRPARITVSPGKQRLEFHYTGLEFAAPTAIRFRYKLEGYDREWLNAGTRREAVYTRVPPGQYQFRVSAANNDGVWNESGATVALTVIPPWWQTWWFQGMGIIGLCGLVFGVYELRLYQHKKARALQESFARRLIDSQEQERKRVAHELHDSLGQSLQIIKGRTQLGSRQAGNATECVQQFREIGEATSRAIQEVRAISRALRPAELDQLGLTKAIEWMVENVSGTSATRFDCDVENVDGLFIPGMEISLYRIVQEGLNNVLKHAAATEVILELKREPNAVRFSLLDNGRGFIKAERAGGGLGLESIAERAKLLDGSFDIQSAPLKGTRLTVVVPVPVVRA